MQETKEPSSTMLYVSNLPFSFVDDDLKKIFSSFDVTSAYVATRRNGRSKGFGFVTFKNEEQQKKALELFDGKDLDGRTLSVNVAHKDERRDAKGELKEEFKTNQAREPRKRREKRKAKKQSGAEKKEPSETILYVSNLPFEYSDDDLKKVFAAHNPTSARIARRKNERSKGFGFVEFGNHKDQQAALALNSHSIGEREIAVKVSMIGEKMEEVGNGNNSNANNNAGGAGAEKKAKKVVKKEKEPKSTATSETTLYVSNLPFELSDEGLADVFKNKRHAPASARIARRRDSKSKGFGFVEFADNAAQKAALAAMDGVTLADRLIAVKVALKDSETKPEEKGQDKNAETPKRRRSKKKNSSSNISNNNNSNNNNNNNNNNNKPKKNAEAGEKKERPARTPKADKKNSDTLVYVSNLAFEVDDAALGKLFEGHHVKSAHVAVRRNGRSKGFGFVEFATHEEQQKALSKSGTDLQGRKLTVEVAKENVEGDKKDDKKDESK